MATSSSGPDVSGRWVGLAPDGFIATGACDTEDDLTLDLTQSGSNLTGTATATLRASSCSQQLGGQRSFAVTGSLSGSSVALTLTRSNQFGTSTSNLTGTVSGPRMSGTFTASFFGSTASGTWAVNRQ